MVVLRAARFRAVFNEDVSAVAPMDVLGKSPSTSIGHGVDKSL
jgi:hypothetical protein